MTRGRTITVLFLLIGVGAVVIALTAARDTGPDKADPAPAKPVARTVTMFGTVDTEKPHYYVVPDALIPGKVLKVLVNEGDEVNKDDPLLELDQRSHDKQIEIAEQIIKQAKLELEKAEVFRDLHPKEIDAAHEAALAKYALIEPYQESLKEFDRIKDKAGVGRDDERALLKAKLEAATKEYEVAKIQYETLKKKPVELSVKSAQLAVDLAKKKKEEAELAKSKMVCLAPVKGKIARSNAFVGMIFGPQTKEPAFVIHESSPLIVRAEVQQEFASRIVDNAKCKIEDQDDVKGQWTGQITRIANFFGPRNYTARSIELTPLNDARVLQVIIKVDTPKDAPKLRIGQQVRIVITTE